MEQRCIACSEVKPVSEFKFEKRRNKYAGKCKSCANAYERERIKKKAHTRPDDNNSTKTCGKCKKELSVSEFFFRKDTGDYRSECKTCTSQQHRDYYQKNREKIATYAAEYRLLNRDAILAAKRDWHERNRNRSNAKMRENYEANKAAYIKRAYERKGRVRKAPGSHTFGEIVSLWHKQGGKCVYCEGSLGGHPENTHLYHRDHFVPLSKGGSDDISNIQLLCPSCNLSKSNKMPGEFAQERFGRLF